MLTRYIRIDAANKAVCRHQTHGSQRGCHGYCYVGMSDCISKAAKEIVVIGSANLYWHQLWLFAVHCCSEALWRALPSVVVGPFIRAYASERVWLGNLNKEYYKPFSGSVIVNLKTLNQMYDNNTGCQWYDIKWCP